MKRRLVEAYDRMMMPDACARRIEQKLVSQMEETKGGRYTVVMSPAPRQNWWAIATGLVCLVLMLSVGGSMLFLRMPERALSDSMETTDVQQTNARGDYTMVTDIPAERVEAFAKHVRQNVLDKDWDALAEKIQYPIDVQGQTAADAGDFVELIGSGAMEPNVTEVFAEESCTAMFCNWQGICLADGYIWINEVDSELKITAINGMLLTVAEEEAQHPAVEEGNAVTAEFIGILLESRTFYSHDYEKDMSIAEYCETFGAGSDITVEVSKFTVVDMDGDGINEVVLWLRVNGSDDYGTMVLRYQDGKAHGYTFSYRQLFNLRKDGSFDYSGGGDNDGSAVLKFTKFDCYSEKISMSDRDEKAFAQWHIYPCTRANVVLGSYEYASEEWGGMLGSQFWYFEELAKGNRENNWDSLKESVARDGMVYTEGEGVFSVYDPDNPGCWMYGVLTNANGFDQLAEMGYYVCNENGEFQAEIRELLSDTPAYAIDVTLGSGGTEVASVDAVFNYFGQEELNSGGIRDALQIRALMDDFARHYFANDMEACDCLADTFAGRVEGYSPSGEPTIISHKGLPTEAMRVGDTCSVSLKLLEPGETDSYSYLSMELIRQEDGWKVRSYALEK